MNKAQDVLNKLIAVESHVTNTWRLSDSQYAKTGFRAYQASLSYPEKVKQVVSMQQRMVPIYAARGKVVVPWKVDV